MDNRMETGCDVKEIKWFRDTKDSRGGSRTTHILKIPGCINEKD